MQTTNNFLKEYGKSITLMGITFCVFGSFVFFFSTKNTGILRISFIDVGQGDGVFIQTPSRKTMVIDGGPGNKVVQELSKKMSFFNKNIDIVLATHPDADHVTGLIPILENYHAATVVVSPAESKTEVFATLQNKIEDEKKDGAEVHVGNLGDVITFGDGVTFTVVSPSTDVWHGEETNDESITGVLSYGDYTFLLTGDLPSTKEGTVIKTGLVPQHITVLKAGHHGSKYSSGNMFLNYLQPFYAVISAGKDNRYGHPNPETLGRLENSGAHVLSTIEEGTITFETDGKSLTIRTSKQDSK